jgi:predicted homoserine dehydrogenase-like protein
MANKRPRRNAKIVNYLRHFGGKDVAIAACLVGAGAFGRSLLGRAAALPWLDIPFVVDRDMAVAAAGFASAGVPREQIALCGTAADARAARARGKRVAASRLEVVLDLTFDILVEASGHPEAAGVHAMRAIEAGRHVAMVSKEADSVIGPYLAAEAAARGCVCTPVDGDQPSLLIGLITWAELLGFPIVAAGKSSEYDFVYSPSDRAVISNGCRVPVTDFERLWSLGEQDVPALVATRAAQLASLPQHIAPDLCELLIVANATGLGVDTPALHAPIARITEVPSILSLRSAGGLLGCSGSLDVFHCLRMADEVSFAGGVFVVVRCEDDTSWDMLAAKGHIVSRSRDTALLYQPRHLLGLEAAISLLDAVKHGTSSGGAEPRPVLDMLGRARRVLRQGTRLGAEGHHHEIDGVAPELHPAGPLGEDRAVPFYLLDGRALRRDVPAGELIRLGDLDMDAASPLFRMRCAQDALFAKEGVAA